MTIAALRRLDPEPPPGADELPCDDGEPMETERHLRQMVLLIQALEDAWRDRQDYYVGGNMFLYHSLLQTKQNDFRGPDVFVVPVGPRAGAPLAPRAGQGHDGKRSCPPALLPYANN